MSFRISPLWWPVLGLISPILVPFLISKNKKFNNNLKFAEKLNSDRLLKAKPLELPELDFLELTVIVEEKTEKTFLGDAAVSYLFKSNQGSLLFDIGFGIERPAMVFNACKLGIKLDQVDSLCVSHLHPDHMGGLKASKGKTVIMPRELGSPKRKMCFLPDNASADGFTCENIQ